MAGKASQPRLYDCVAKYFLFLVTFRRNAGRVAMDEKWVRRNLVELLGEAEKLAAGDPKLLERFTKVKYALVALADEIILDSAWEAHDAWSGHLLEMQYFDSSIAGAELFERLRTVDAGDGDSNEIYFVVLTLGFRGMYRTRPEELRELQQSLYLRIPDRIDKRTDQLCPQTYEFTVERDLTRLPTLKAIRVGIVLGAGILVLLVTSWLIYRGCVADLVLKARAVAEKT